MYIVAGQVSNSRSVIIDGTPYDCYYSYEPGTDVPTYIPPPTPTIEYWNCENYRVIATKGIKHRKSPSITAPYNPGAGLRYGEVIEVCETVYETSNGIKYLWGKVFYNGQWGWSALRTENMYGQTIYSFTR